MRSPFWMRLASLRWPMEFGAQETDYIIWTRTAVRGVATVRGYESSEVVSGLGD
ncbi:MAG TPA: hypothetical protein VMB66_07150 [Candidatus Acidoferrales bacterium]|nr:hypothetical protein [Candidatus Acidoferrales bacterium]